MRDTDNPFGKYSHLLGNLQLKPTALLGTAEKMQYTKLLEYHIDNQIHDKNVKGLRTESITRNAVKSQNLELFREGVNEGKFSLDIK